MCVRLVYSSLPVAFAGSSKLELSNDAQSIQYVWCWFLHLVDTCRFRFVHWIESIRELKFFNSIPYSGCASFFGSPVVVTALLRGGIVLGELLMSGLDRFGKISSSSRLGLLFSFWGLFSGCDGICTFMRTYINGIYMLHADRQAQVSTALLRMCFIWWYNVSHGNRTRIMSVMKPIKLFTLSAPTGSFMRWKLIINFQTLNIFQGLCAPIDSLFWSSWS